MYWIEGQIVVDNVVHDIQREVHILFQQVPSVLRLPVFFSRVPLYPEEWRPVTFQHNV